MQPGTGRRVVIVNGKREMSEDLKFLMHPRRAESKSVIRRHWHSPGVLNQGSTSQCVIYAADKYLTTSPVRNQGFITPQRRSQIYKEVQRLDEWPGEAYEGTSVRAMMKWLQREGYIQDYHWAFAAEAIVDHVLAPTGGPVEMGTIWDDHMMSLDKYGYLFSDTDDTNDEGHAWTIIGADRERVHPKTKDVGACRWIQSWGEWGQKGRGWITFKELQKLVSMAGEAAIANEIKRAA